MNQLNTIASLSCIALLTACGGGGGGGGNSNGGLSTADTASTNSGSSSTNTDTSGGSTTTDSGNTGSTTTDSGSTTTDSGSTGGTTAPSTAPQSYEKLTGSTNKEVELDGIGIETFTTKVRSADGTYNPNTKALSTRIGFISTDHPNGPVAPGTYQDGFEKTSFKTEFNNQNYEYVALVAQETVVGQGIGIAGVATNPTDIPTAATATYTGGATGSYTTANGSVPLVNGKSKVDANFGTGKVNVTMNGFSTRTSGGTIVDNPPVTDIKVQNMKISGNGFSGGNIRVLNNGVETYFAPSAYADAQGKFFGYDANNSVPDEVGGVVVKADSDQAAIGVFVAD